MRVFLRPTDLHSRAMSRTADALAKYSPYYDIALTGDLARCDLQILHVINQDAIPYARAIRDRGGKYAVIQYCFRTAGGELRDWLEMWRGAEVVWSYLEDVRVLSQLWPHGVPEGWAPQNGDEDFNCYYAPLGVDEVFRTFPVGRTRPDRILTTGYVTGPGAEPIWEVWRAAEIAGIEALHIGPHSVEGMDACPSGYPRGWKSLSGLSDRDLAYLYSTSTWVSGLRHVEGFELPAAEGLVCGARPLIFGQPSMQKWYSGLGLFIPDINYGLVPLIAAAFTELGKAVTREERESALARFDWERIAKGFWEALLR